MRDGNQYEQHKKKSKSKKGRPGGGSRHSFVNSRWIFILQQWTVQRGQSLAQIWGRHVERDYTIRWQNKHALRTACPPRRFYFSVAALRILGVRT